VGQPGVILLDTHVVAWLADEGSRISKAAHAAIDESRKNDSGLAICSISFLEMATLASKGRMRLTGTLEAFLQEVEARFAVLPMSSRICARMNELPANYPKDPADRVIGATALVEGIALLTADREIRRCKAVRTIW
jgi:PIN domain nuclease of toxin-antitoxin system